MAKPLYKRNLVKTPIERFPQRKVIFPLSPSFSLVFLEAHLDQEFDSHDKLVLKFAGKIENVNTFIGSGDPVEFKYSGAGSSATWVGYVHKIVPSTVMDNVTTVICLSPTYLLKTTKQKIYKNVTADQIVQKVCKQYGLKAVTQRHPRVFSTIGQAGQSDWQLLRRLAKQTGFGLKITGTTVYFMSKNKLSSASTARAPYFYRETAAPTVRTISAMGTLLDFIPQISDEAPDMEGATVDRVVSGLHTTNNKTITTKHKINPAKKKTNGAVTPSKKFLKK
jgi:hypothetical protein